MLWWWFPVAVTGWIVAWDRVGFMREDIIVVPWMDNARRNEALLSNDVGTMCSVVLSLDLQCVVCCEIMMISVSGLKVRS